MNPYILLVSTDLKSVGPLEIRFVVHDDPNMHFFWGHYLGKLEHFNMTLL